MSDSSEHRSVHESLFAVAQASGWKWVSASEAQTRRRKQHRGFFDQTFEERLAALNPGVVTPENLAAIVSAIEAVPRTIDGTADWLTWLRGEKLIAHPSEARNVRVKLVDFVRADRNVFEFTDEWTCDDGPETTRRSGAMFLINGVPVAFVESNVAPARSAVEKVLARLARHRISTPEILPAAAVFNITELIEHLGAATRNLETTNIVGRKNESGSSTAADTGTRLRRLFEPAQFLTALRLWIVSHRTNDAQREGVLWSHQMRAVERIAARASDTTGKTSLAWHAQGSGKTFTLLTAAQVILELGESFSSTTVVLILDHNEFEGQLAGWVAPVLGDLRSRALKIERAQSKAHLYELLDAHFHGMIVTKVHTFDTADKNFCKRSNVVVLLDEAHRSMGGRLLAAFPNAKFIGFAGTPIDTTVRGQRTRTFLDADDAHGYLDSHTIAQSIADGTTLKLRSQFVPDELIAPARLLEKEFLALTQPKGVSEIEELDHLLDRATNLKTFLKSKDHVEKVAAFVAQHFRENVQPRGYKAFLVAVDREACALYKQALDRLLPPEWIAPIYAKTSEDSTQRLLDEKVEASARRTFPKPGGNPQILIVTDQLLSGYDAPVLYCLYLAKPMRDHVLLQTIARVNRPYIGANRKSKPCGLIVDFVGVLKDPKKALAFEPEDISSLIENVDVLQARFVELMSGSAKDHLPAFTTYETPDVAMARLLKESFTDEKNRTAYFDFFEELEDLYDILSPAPWLNEHIESYGRLAALREMIVQAYPPPLLTRSKPSRKTQRLVRENAAAYGLEPTETISRLDEATLAELLDNPDTDEVKVSTLAHLIIRECSSESSLQPLLVSFAQQAARIVAMMEPRLISPSVARTSLKDVAAEIIALQQAHEALIVSADVFSVFSRLQDEDLVDSETLACEIDTIVQRFAHPDSDAAARQLLSRELLAVQLRHLDGPQLIELADRLLAPARGSAALSST